MVVKSTAKAQVASRGVVDAGVQSACWGHALMSLDDIELITRVASRNRLSPVAKISRCTTGICNRVYSIDDAFILKIEGGYDWSRGILRHQSGIVDKLLSERAKVPRIIDYGEFDGRQYLLMEKLRGDSLVSG
jgi:hypothetical protein